VNQSVRFSAGNRDVYLSPTARLMTTGANLRPVRLQEKWAQRSLDSDQFHSALLVPLPLNLDHS